MDCCLLPLCMVLVLHSVLLCGGTEVRHIFKHSKHKYIKMKGEKFLNTWAVIVHGDERMASRVAAKYGFVRKGKIFGDVYEFVHTGIPRRRERAAFKKTLHLTRDPRVVWAQQQVGKIRKKRSEIFFNDARWSDQWYLHRTEESKFKGHDMNVVPVWKQGITGKGVVVSILDDGIEYTHPELAQNYDPKASYDFNNNDNDPKPRLTWGNENRHGTRCAAEVAAVANNSKCIVGVAYGASIGGIRMLDGVVTDKTESQSLSYARDHIDIYSSSWGPDDDGMTVDGPGALTKAALAAGAAKGRKGKGNIFVWASGNGGNRRDNCNCDGYTNSIYTISVSAATSNGVQPWYLESCASTLVSAYSSGTAENNERQIVTADLRGYGGMGMGGECTDTHTGTSVSAPLVAGFIALALEANPSLTWRDVQHLLVETSHLSHLVDLNGDFKYNGVGKRYSHHFGFGIVNGADLVNLAKKWHTVGEQRRCHYREIKKFPFTRFTRNSPLVLHVNTTACKGTTHHIRYIEHVHVQVNLYHDKRGATEILVVSPMGTESWILKERPKDSEPNQFQDWLFLSTHFWGEDPNGMWTVTFMSKGDEGDVSKEGYLQDMVLIVYGTHQKPGAKRKHKDAPSPGYKCHQQCRGGCNGPKNNQCNSCKRKYYLTAGRVKHCVESCPASMYQLPGSKLCLPCHKTCVSCRGGNVTDCISCPVTHGLSEGRCLEQCPPKMFKKADELNKRSFLCAHCAARCTSCVGHAENCTACDKGSILKGNTCYAKCSSSHWLEGEKCSKCHPTCKTCIGGKSTNCTKCKKKALNDLENRYLYKGECLTSCPLRTFYANTVMRDCTECPKNCLKCSQDGRKCDVCDISYFMITSADGQCVKTCPDGYHADVVRRTCEPCDLHCKTCVPGNPSACTSCLKNYFLKAHECVAKSECQTRYFVNETKGKCDVCPPTCSFCRSAEFCTQCYLSYFLTPDNKCVDKCPVGTYAYRRDTCQKCASSCLECDGPTSDDCLACRPDQYLLHGRCRATIPPGFYAQKIKKQQVLRRCHQHCTECTGPKLKDCNTCIDKFDKRDEGCVNPCPGQWLSANKCDTCHRSCAECYGPYASQCLVCNNNFTLNVETHSCSKGCHRRSYKEKSTSMCKPCHHSCASCFGPSPSQCLTCPDKFQFHQNTCVWQCPTGWYKTFGGKCAPCSKKCNKCLYKYDLCTACSEGEVLTPGFKCANTCGPNKFYDSSRRCYSCHESCLTCSSNAADGCLSCSSGMTLYKGMCVRGCLPGFYNSSKENKCVPCMDDCLKCKESPGHDLKCEVCSNTTYLLPTGRCAKQCPPASYRKLTENVCGPCPGYHCLDCQADQGKSCTKCKQFRQVSKGLCKSICGRGNYPNDTLKRCEKCHPLCFTCDGPTQYDCIRCHDHSYSMKVPRTNGIVDMHCLSVCPTGYYSENKICKSCPKDCTECADASSCSACRDGMLLFNASCQPACPEGYTNDSSNTCVPCSKQFHKCSVCEGQKCTGCSPGFYLQENRCVKECGISFSVENGVCVPCARFDEHCTECLNGSSCSRCELGFIWNDTKCIVGCEEKYRMVNGSCEKCSDDECLMTVVSTTAKIPTTTSTTTTKVAIVGPATKLTTAATIAGMATINTTSYQHSTKKLSSTLDTLTSASQNSVKTMKSNGEMTKNTTFASIDEAAGHTLKSLKPSTTAKTRAVTAENDISMKPDVEKANDTRVTKSVLHSMNATPNMTPRKVVDMTKIVILAKKVKKIWETDVPLLPEDSKKETLVNDSDDKMTTTLSTTPMKKEVRNSTNSTNGTPQTTSSSILRKVVVQEEVNDASVLPAATNKTFDVDATEETMFKTNDTTTTTATRLSGKKTLKVLKALEKNMSELTNGEPNQSITVVPEKHPKRAKRSISIPGEDSGTQESDTYPVLLVAFIAGTLVVIPLVGGFFIKRRRRGRLDVMDSY